MTLEELLNKLIEKGWKPFDRNYQRYEHGCLIREFTTEDGVYSYGQYPTTYREFCGKESGLWQFVCENGMIREKTSLDKKMYYQGHRPYDAQWEHHKYMFNEYGYWLIRSALCDEDKLEEFILENIKIDETT